MKGFAAVPVLVVVAVVLSACGSSGRHPTPPPPKRVAAGAKVALNYNCVFPSASLMPQASATRAGWIRIVISWVSLESVKGRYNQAYLRHVTDCVEAAHRYGLDVLAVFIATPRWANHDAGWRAPPTDDRTFATAIGYLARTYRSSSGSGINAFEIWNEVNTRAFWTGTVSQYERLLAAGAAAVRANSSAKVVLAGTAHIDEPWDRAILADGYGRYFDVLGVHPYPRIHANTDVADVFNGRRNAPNTLEQLRRDLDHFGFPNTPIWLTEIGWSTQDIGEAAQAAVLTRMYDYIRHSGCYACSSIQLAFWYALLDTTGGLDGGMSLLNPNGSPKPAYRSLARLPVRS